LTPASSTEPGSDWKLPVAVAVLTTALVTLLSRFLPESASATGVGLAFLTVTYLVALRSADTDRVRHYGLSLGGLLETEPLGARKMLVAGVRALGWAALFAAVTFPAFWAGFWFWYRPQHAFSPNSALLLSDEAWGQLLVIALPEEAFYRGYLQTAFDDVLRHRWTLLGAKVGPSLLLSSALFALGHLLTEPNLSRLAVFFPALLFGWLRARTGGIGPAVLFHAMCNLFSWFLASSYGLL
jgi:hypothetical protein